MKALNRTYRIVISLVLLGLALASCKKEEKKKESLLNTKWQSEQLLVEGKEPIADTTVIMTIMDDGKMSFISRKHGDMSGQLSDDEKVIRADEDGVMIDLFPTLKGEKLHLFRKLPSKDDPSKILDATLIFRRLR